MGIPNKYSLLTKLTSYIFPYCIEQREGNVSPYLEVVLDSGKLMLNTNQVNYSYGSLHKIFFNAFNKLKIQEREIENVLILGFGAGSIATLLTETFYRDCKMTGVEIDEVVLDLAKKHFNIDRFKKLSIHATDAYTFVLECKEKFDLIIMDVFVDDCTPPFFSSSAFLSALNNLLAPSGMICYNRMVSTLLSRRQAKNVITSINRIIGPTFLFKYRMGGADNWMIVHDRGSAGTNYDFEGIDQKNCLHLN